MNCKQFLCDKKYSLQISICHTNADEDIHIYKKIDRYAFLDFPNQWKSALICTGVSQTMKK